MKGHILVVDDEQETCDLLEMSLGRHGFKVTASTNAQRALDLVAEQDFDVVLTDLQMPEMTGLDLCERVLGTRPDMPVVVITGQGSLETAIGAIRVGAYDFITKPVDPKLLFLSVSRAIQHRRLSDEVRRLRQAVDGDEQEARIVGQSGAMRRVYELISRVGESDASVLIHGETGTGKELIARGIHNRSRRKSGPFVAINCAAVPHSLLESELFGHARGAFTDAKAQRTGLFVQATGGTLFLDEIGELPIDVQPKLLRALQERKVRPVGANSEIPFDARIVAATNRNLEKEVAEGRFREDLYYRLKVFPLRVPPLRERREDIPLIATHFLTRFALEFGKPSGGFSQQAMELLQGYDWPGNVRELQNEVQRLVIQVDAGGFVTPEMLSPRVRQVEGMIERVRPTKGTLKEMMDQVERWLLIEALREHGNNKTAAAKSLGITREGLHKKLRAFGL